jgi:probable F420-dependent oxidoreductase
MTSAAKQRMKIGVKPFINEGGMNGQTARYRDIQAMAQAAEAAGFDSFWLADHVLFREPGEEEKGAWEALTFLSALAATTPRVSIGSLVACTSFRNPALLAKMADSLDEISGGRFILGLGAGWHEPEYTAFGFPFDHRAARFEEALQIIAPLLREGHVDFSGQFYSARDCVLRPRGPTTSGPPIWIGAKGPRMMRLVARYADAWNTVWHPRPQDVVAAKPKLDEACAAVGRDPATIALTAGSFARFLSPGEQPPQGQRDRPDATTITGSPEQMAQALRDFEAAGVTHLVLNIEPCELRSIERLGPVIALLRAS